MNTTEKYQRFLMDIYPMAPIEIVRGKGTKLWDANGTEYVDVTSAQGVVGIGYANESVNQAITRQLSQLGNHYNSFYHPLRAELAEKLAQITPAGLEKSFFCNSGTESVEAAIKFARASTKKKQIIAFQNGFHGRTMGALSATWKKEFREPFEPAVPGFVHVPFNDLEAVKKAVSADTAAVILELVQGEGGVFSAKPEFVKELSEFCNQKEILVIIDEVQTGFGRTGRWFACEHYGIEPDILCVAKSMANGFPAGATVCNDKIKIGKKMHGSTFGGNPVTCAAALATIEYLEKNNVVENAAQNGENFFKQLRALDSKPVREIRGLGLMIGVELSQRVSPFLSQLAERGVLALPAGSLVLRFLPPLIISKTEIDFATEQIAAVLSNGRNRVF